MRMIVAVISASCFLTTAFAGDEWSTCSSADSVYVIEDGIVIAPKRIDGEEYKITKNLKTTLLKTNKEFCTTAIKKEDKLSQLEEITYEHSILTDHQGNITVDFICQRGEITLEDDEICDASTIFYQESYAVK